MWTGTIQVEISDVEDATEGRCESFWSYLAEMIAEEYLESLGMRFDLPQVVEAS